MHEFNIIISQNYTTITDLLWSCSNSATRPLLTFLWIYDCDVLPWCKSFYLAFHFICEMRLTFFILFCFPFLVVRIRLHSEWKWFVYKRPINFFSVIYHHFRSHFKTIFTLKEIVILFLIMLPVELYSRATLWNDTVTSHYNGSKSKRNLS